MKLVKAYALSDGNSIYRSCECVFDASQKTRTFLVPSDNDGCAVAHMAEAKALGIGMGDPHFQIRDMCGRGGVKVFSSNYALYGDMPRLIDNIDRNLSPRVESLFDRRELYRPE